MMSQSTWRHARSALAMTALGGILFTSSGCAVGMAMSGKQDKDTSILFLGAPRQVVISKLGPPETSTVNENGERVDNFLVKQGNRPNEARAAVHAAMDVVTWGAWELVGTPMEIGAARTDKTLYIVTYDAKDLIKDIQAVAPSKRKKAEDKAEKK